ncbi:uncharacterized protein LOC120616397 [Pteropus medius]|uniref:uncharacterized protein LOC120616397 n=1 Tax=Pteropus vampyrus TaxID=132908 RepID=UPI00196AA8AA|nr:uncharacterized protein LOC120616397 [Pteropus giganteus]
MLSFPRDRAGPVHFLLVPPVFEMSVLPSSSTPTSAAFQGLRMTPVRKLLLTTVRVYPHPPLPPEVIHRAWQTRSHRRPLQDPRDDIGPLRVTKGDRSDAGSLNLNPSGHVTTTLTGSGAQAWASAAAGAEQTLAGRRVRLAPRRGCAHCPRLAASDKSRTWSSSFLPRKAAVLSLWLLCTVPLVSLVLGSLITMDLDVVFFAFTLFEVY